MSKITVDDGFNPEFVECASFDGDFEIPCIEAPKEIIIPDGMIPFSIRKQSLSKKEFIVFYEYDTSFGGVLKQPEVYLEEFSHFPGIVTLDNSVYVDSPLTVQIANIYRSRAIGHYFQAHGIYTIPNVRWGDERSYTTSVFREKFAFLGLPKHSIYSIGTYGCCKTKEEKFHLRNGLISMLDELDPQVILVYGAMPEYIFSGLKNRTRFIQYPDWISSKKGGPDYGNR